MENKAQFEQENSVDLSLPANTSEYAPEVEAERKVTSDTAKGEEEPKVTNDATKVEAENSNFKVEEKRGKEPARNNRMKKNIKGFASTLAAGVIGSVLTLTILPHTDYVKNFQSQADDQPVQIQQTGPQAKPVSAQAGNTNSIANTVERVSKAIVGIENYQQQQSVDFFGNTTGPSQNVEQGSGSGVIFEKKNGHAYIVTNNHVVEGASKLEVSLYDGTKTQATVVGTDALTDLAVLKIDEKNVNATAEFGDSATLRPGDQVYAIGNPLGSELSRTVTQGIVSATNRSISVPTSAGNWETTVIQTDAAINPGNSGGALINPEGQIVGINSMKISESGVEGLGFAIPSNDVIPIVNQLIKNGKIERPYLGIGLADLNEVPQIYWGDLPKDVTKGVIVMNIDPNSAAARAGFQPKDVIVSMNGEKISSSAELRKYLYTKVKSGDDIKCEIYRDGKLKTLTVKLTNKRTAD
ncbi:S1C family serine protease [Neobacillus mesonae]|uniref:S1C family serine protease n=1 Tax=Neobacillus mesonae TaxID=1193713 RepID=UPI002E225FB5|nr:S1C family serine protease [Neobacillus mesonae]